jgi:hypothetical protein
MCEVYCIGYLLNESRKYCKSQMHKASSFVVQAWCMVRMGHVGAKTNNIQMEIDGLAENEVVLCRFYRDLALEMNRGRRISVVGAPRVD